MIDAFNQLVGSVLKYITELNRSKRTKDYYDACFKQLGEYLETNYLLYSPEEANRWLHSMEGQLSKDVCQIYKAAIEKLNALVLHGETQKNHYDKQDECSTSVSLNTEFQTIKCDFIKSISGKSDTAITNIDNICSEILGDIQNSGVNSISDLSYDSLLREISEVKEKTAKASLYMVLDLLLQFLYAQGLTRYGYTLLVGCLAKRNGYPGSPYIEANTIDELEQGYKVVSLEKYLECCDSIYSEHAQAGYSQESMQNIRKRANRFFLFMDMNNLNYTPKCADIWLESIRPYVCEVEYKACRRFVYMVEEHLAGHDLCLESHFVFKETLFSQLPTWCRPEVTQFVELKEKEGWTHSTVKMYRECICRFCSFIDSKGIKGFNFLTPAVIKLYNESDYHSTPESKNAYNSRVRKFLEYLGEMGCLSNKYLFLSLPSVCAPKESLIVVLSNDEQKQIEETFHEDSTAISLREKAMLQLGLYMGIRSCDILNLTIDSIDWDNATLKILQEKTNREIILPMPVQVANALYRYIMYERPTSDSKKIFLSSRAPYCPMSKNTCRVAMSHALPNRKVHGSSFHTIRKTYATNLLRNNATPDQVSEALGHKNQMTVHKYMYLDEIRMRQCAFSLGEKGLTMKGGFKHGD